MIRVSVDWELKSDMGRQPQKNTSHLPEDSKFLKKLRLGVADD